MRLGTKIDGDGPYKIAGRMDFGTGRHIFDVRGLGPAPYTLTDFDDDGGSCQYCNHHLVKRYWLRPAKGEPFYVGADCVLKSGDSAIIAIVQHIDRETKKLARRKGLPMPEAFRIELEARRAVIAMFYGAIKQASGVYRSFEDVGQAIAHAFRQQVAA